MEELQRQLEESEAQRDALLEEAQRNLEQANADAEAHIAALEEEIALLQSQLDEARSG